MKARDESKQVSFEPTISEHFQHMHAHSSHSLEDKLFAVSMGEYRYSPRFDNQYRHWPALFRFCWEWVLAHAEGNYVEWKTEADCMNWGMNRLGAQNIKAPPGWMRAIRTLRGLHTQSGNL